MLHCEIIFPSIDGQIILLLLFNMSPRAMTLRDKLLNHSSFCFENNIFYQKELPVKNLFEKKYIELRKLEHRVYSDEVVRSLPDFNERGPLEEEWAIRKITLKKLIKHFEKETERI